MGEHIKSFRSRLSRLERKYHGMQGGYTAKLRSDGLIVISPNRAKRRISLLPVVFFAAAFIGFKAFLLLSLGAASYDERVARLQEGTGVEKVGAFVMQSDPVTAMVAQRVHKTLN